MDFDYYGVTSELDAREILRYLNHLGIRNISGEVLKYFITDLKKLIKYDLEQKKNQNDIKYSQGPERLHSATTFSSRLRSTASSGPVAPCGRECQGYRRPLTVRNIHSAPNLGHLGPSQGDKPLRRACSCVRVEKKPDSVAKESKVTTSCYNLIKVPKVPPKKKCDPVSLYHYYTALWEKYKPNVPGENNWAELRWSIRQKMAGCEPQKAPE